MHHNFHLVPLFSGIVNLLLAVFVVAINPRRRVNQIFLLLGVGLAWWNFGAFSLANVESADQVLWRVRITVVSAIFLPVIFYQFAIETTAFPTDRWKLRSAYSCAFLLLALDFTPLFIAGVRPYKMFFRASGGPAFWFFGLVYVPVMAVVTLRLLGRYMLILPPSSGPRGRVLFSAVLLVALGGLHDILTVLGYDNYPGTTVHIRTWGALGPCVYGLMVGYSILSDQLLDVRISISRHAATALRFCFLMAIAYMLMLVAGAVFPAAFTGVGVAASLAIILASAIITANFSPKLFGGISSRLEHHVCGDHFEYQDKITTFIESGPDSDNVQELLDSTASLVFEQMNVSAVGIAVFGSDSRVRGFSTRDSQGVRMWTQVLSSESHPFKFFATSGQPLLDIRTDLRVSVDECDARAALTADLLELAISIAARPRSPLGLIVVGPRRDGHPLTKLDVELLIALSRSLVSRIERIAIIQNEELRQSNRAKDQFLASINHEIRNPMNGISGIVQMLGDHYSDYRSSFLLKTLQSCNEQLRSTMDDVLDFSRIESESVTLVMTEVDLIELVRTTCASLDVNAERLLVTGVPSQPVLVRCDAGKVRQILVNYLANALKYGVPLGGEVALSVALVSDGRIAATITVSSTGPTLSEEEINVLFTALTRGRRARETNAHGTGLGLALCKKLARAMDGTVGVNSAHGKTTFWFKAEFEAVSALPTHPTVDLARFSGRCALAIEDEDYNRLVLGHFLDRLQVSVTWAENGQAAIAAASCQSFDVILMDWLLPDMDGSELLAKIREQRQTPLPPVFVLSAYSTTSKRAECLAAGAVAFISKPIDLAKLTAAFDGCDFGPLSKPEDRKSKPTTIVDLSSLFALGNESFVITSFLREVQEGQSRLASIWRDDPRKAALLVHRLRAQMTLVHAKDCADVLEVLERGLNERWSADDIQRLIADVAVSLEEVTESVKVQGVRSAKPIRDSSPVPPQSVVSLS